MKIRTIQKLLTLVVFGLLSQLAIAQHTLSGSSNVEIGDEPFYTLQEDLGSGFGGLGGPGTITSVSWNAGPRGTVLTSSNSQAQVRWNSSGSSTLQATVSYSGGSSINLTKTVTIVVGTPDVPTVSINVCGDKTLSRGTPPPGVIWYWQTTLNGVSTGNSSPTYNVSGSDIYYLRAKEGVNWSASSASVTVTGNAPAYVPMAVQEVNVNVDRFDAKWLAVSGATYRLDVSTSPSFSSFVGGFNDKAVTGTSETVYGLLPGKNYYYRVRSVNASGCVSDNSSVITATTGIDAPPVTPAVNRTAVSFKANWLVVSGVSSFRLYVSTNNGFTSHVSGYNGKVVTGTNHNVTGLIAGKNYYYRLKSDGPDADSGYSGTIATNTTISAPTALEETNRTATGFKAKWSAASGVSNYKLYISTNTNFTSHVSGYNGKAVTGTDFTVTGLVAGQNYYYRLKSDGPDADSGYSNDIFANTTISAPTAHQETNNTDVSFRANWSAASGVSNYKLYVSTNTNFTSHVSGYNGKVVTGTNHTVTGLVAGKYYYYRLKSDGPDADSGYSNSITANTTISAPTAIEETNRTATGFKAKWSAASGVSNYKLYISTNTNFTSHVSGYNGKAVTGTNFTVTGLVAGQNYYYRLKSDGPDADSGYSNDITANTTISAPTANQETNNTDVSFRANWSAASGVSNYKLYVSTSSDFSSHLSGYNGKAVTATSYVVTGLVAGKYYYYRLKSDGPDADSGYSSVITANTTIGTPVAIEESNKTTTSFMARWQAVIGVTNYRLYVSTSSDFSSHLSGYNGKVVSGTQYTVTGLAPGTYFYYRLKSDGPNQDSGYSNVITANSQIDTTVAGEETEISPTSFKANWSSVSGVSNFRLYVSKQSDFSSYVSGYNGKSVTGINSTVTGLVAGEKYYYRLKAAGPSLNSVFSNVITAQTTIVAPVATEESNRTTTSFKARWSAAAGVTNYKLYVSASSDFSSHLSGYNGKAVTGTSYTVSGLPPGQHFYYRLKSDGPEADSGYSNSITANTTINPTVASEETENSNTSFKANWSAVPGVTNFWLYVSTQSDFSSYVSGYNGKEVSGTSYTMTGLASGELYYYRLKSAGPTIRSVYSNTITAHTIPAPVITAGGSTHLEHLGDKVTLEADQAYDGYLWKADGITVGSSATLDVRIAGTYTLTATVSGIPQAATSNSIVVTGCAEIDGGDRNYVISTDVLKEGMTSVSAVEDLSIEDRSVSISFLDGLGRPMQAVSVEATPDKRHLVQPFVFDELGRETKKYLPYATDDCSVFQVNPLGVDEADYTNSAQYQFYQNEANVAHDIAPFAVSILEYSPLNRLLKQGSPGEAWQPVPGAFTDHVVQQVYETNVNSEVRSFEIQAGQLVASSGSGYYDEGQLRSVVTVDEDGNEMVEFTNKGGQVVLKQVSTGDSSEPWASTYYVYDNQGNLGFVLPPEGTKEVIANGITQASLDQWAFQYKYDKYNRLTEKRVPGSGWVYMVYDKLDRLVAAQDANQRENDQWTFTKYDAINRPILTGIYTNGAVDQAAMQAVVDGYTHLSESIGSTVLGYTNNTFPDVSNANDYLTVSYYDDYANLPSAFSAYNYVAELGNGTNHTNLKSQVVGGQVKMLDGSNTWLKSKIFYDDRYRVLQTITDHQLDADRITNEYDFAGRVLETQSTHNAGGTSVDIVVKETFTYDHASRLLQATHQVDSDPEVILVSNEYNALGELIDKKLHSADAGSNFEQSVDYRYNIRGWVEGINAPKLSSSAEGDYFGMTIHYNRESGIGNTGLFNGNISGIKWSNLSSGGNIRSAYNFEYDGMSRLKIASYKERLGGAGWASSAKFGVSPIKYDLNGNIEELKRFATNESTAMDHLAYEYAGNQLTKVTDSGDGAEGFIDGANQTDEYTYDANGNMISDANKEITNISYNHLNLPETISFTGNRSIVYTYDAAGVKYRKEAIEQTIVPAESTIYTSDFSVNTTGWNAYKAVAQPNWDHTGETDAAKVITNSQNGLHRFQKNLTVPSGEKVRVRAKLYLPSTNNSVDGIQVQVSFSNSVRSQIYTTKDAWFTIDYVTDVVPAEGYTFFYMKDGNSDTFLGSNNDYFFIKDIELIGVDESNTQTVDNTIITDYVGGFIYEEGVLQQFAHAEGRVRVKSDTEYAYDYYLKDHLGNTRVTFSADKPATTYRATMEQELSAEEDQLFLNIGATQEINVAANKTGSNATVNGNEVVRLNGSDPNRRLGPGKMLEVSYGDKVDLEVYAYYTGTPSSNTAIADAAFATLIGNAFGGNAAGAEGEQAIQSAFEGNLSQVVSSSGTGTNTDVRAYLNYIVFDSNFDVVEADYVRVDQGTVDGSHRLLQVNDIEITRAGFVYVYLSNQMGTNFDVFFDELEIAHTSGGILQEDHYYPFGMSISALSSSAPLSKPNNFKYNGFEEQTEFDLNWYDYGARNYDPQLGRWFNVDPAAELMRRHSPYNYAFDNPIRFIDPDGMAPEAAVGDELIIKDENGDVCDSNECTVSSVQRFVDVLNQGLDGFYEVRVTSEGEVVIDKTDKEGEASKEVQALAGELTSVITDENTVTLTISSDKSEVFIGSYKLETVDISDIEKFGNGELQTSAGAAMHEIKEQFEKQVNNQGYPKAHDAAKKVENRVNGSRRIEEGGYQRGNKLIIPYNKNGKTQYLEITVNPANGNIVSVKQ